MVFLQRWGETTAFLSGLSGLRSGLRKIGVDVVGNNLTRRSVTLNRYSYMAFLLLSHPNVILNRNMW